MSVKEIGTYEGPAKNFSPTPASSPAPEKKFLPTPRSFLRFECNACAHGIVMLIASRGASDPAHAPKLAASCPEVDCGAEMTLVDGDARQSIPPQSDAPLVYVGTTMRGNAVTSTFAQSMLFVSSVLSYHGIRSMIRHEIGGSIQAQRSKLATRALDAGATHLMFIDDDIEFDAADIVRLVLADRDVVAGVYPRREIEWAQVAAAVRAGHDPRLYSSVLPCEPKRDANGALVLDGPFMGALSLPAGFLLIKRTVLELLTAQHRDRTFKDGDGKEHVMLFETSVIDGVYRTEDAEFSRRWIAAGGELWIDMRTRLVHHGEYGFTAPTLAQRFEGRT